MVDKVDKQLKKLSKRQKVYFAQLIQSILKGQLASLDVVKLKGRNDVFRVRKGSYRIIFQKSKNSEVKILAFERRSDKTYKTG